MRKHFILLSAFLCLFFAGCAGSPPIHPVDGNGESAAPLNAWVDQSLVPYIVEKLTASPRFKGAPFLLVDMKGDDVQARIDDLTAQIRERVKERLLAQRGLNLVWRPAVKPWRHHTSFSELMCADYRNVAFYIGIDANLTPVDGELYVQARALNVRENRWESGFSISWRGKPNEAQAKALERERTDEYLRGLRPLPFESDQPDLLASYLAHNLSCLFKEGQTDEITVFMERKGDADTPFFKTTLDLVDNYLDSFREVKVATSPEKANTFLQAEVHRINGNLYQMWISSRLKDSGVFVSGAGTEAYVSPGDGVQASGSKARPAPPLIQESTPASEPRVVISSFRILTPASQTFCAAGSPWIGGELELTSGNRLPSGGCVAVEASVSEPARIYLVGQNGIGELTLLFPSKLRELAGFSNLLAPHQALRFPPKSGDFQAIFLEEATGTEWLYLIAAKPEFGKVFETEMGVFVQASERASGSKAMVGNDPFSRWLSFLHAHNRYIQWRSKSIVHVAGLN